MRTWQIGIVCSLALAMSCAMPDSPVTTTTTTVAGSDIPTGYARVQGKLALPSGAADSVANAEVYILGQQQYKVTAAADGAYSLLVDTRKPEIASRSLRLATARPVSLSGLGSFQLITTTATREYGSKVDNVTVTPGQEELLPQITIEKTGSISGKVTLESGADSTGIDIYIPGTSYMARADSEGAFTISKVPVGKYPYIRAESSGYTPKYWTEVLVSPDARTTVNPLVLSVSKGAQGRLIIAGGSAISRSRTVSVTVSYSPEALLMQISEDKDFVDVPWSYLQDSIEYTFRDDGAKTLYVRFADSNGLETSPMSASIIIAQNPVARILSPLNLTSTLRPTFLWEPSVLPSQTYRIQVSGDASFASILEQMDGVTVPRYTMTKYLQDLGSYYWRVAVIDMEGASYQWASGSFTVDISTPVTVQVGSDGIVQNSTPTLTWTSSNQNVRYKVELSKTSDFSSLVDSVSGLTSPTYTPSRPLESETTYYWRVAEEAENGVLGRWSGTSMFTVMLPLVKLIKFSVPQNTRKPIFAWESQALAKTYAIQISEDERFSSIVLEQEGITTSGSFVPANPGLRGGLQYYWRVAYIDRKGGRSTWSVPETVYVGPYEVIALNPSNKVDTSSPVFSWKRSHLTEETYILQISTSDVFTSIYHEESGIRGTTCTPSKPLTNRVQYYWRVRAIASDGDEGPWSNSLPISLDYGSPSLASPGMGVTIYTATPTFSWAGVSWAASYVLQASKRASFSEILVDEESYETAFTPKTIFPDNCDVYWRVAGRDKYGALGAWSEPWKFTLPPHTLNISVTAKLPESSNTIQLPNGSEYVMAASGSLTISIGNSWAYTSYSWSIDGQEILDAQGKRVDAPSITLSGLAIGKYQLSIVAMRNGVPYDVQAWVVVR